VFQHNHILQTIALVQTKYSSECFRGTVRRKKCSLPFGSTEILHNVFGFVCGAYLSLNAYVPWMKVACSLFSGTDIHSHLQQE